MGHIFISYSHQDTDYAHGLAANLQSAGLQVWIDARMDYGSQWPLEIQRQLDACDAFILVMTPRAFRSEWVQSEFQRAKRKLKPIFPLLLEGDEPWLSVESTQYFDVRDGHFPDARFYAALKRVVSISQNAQTFLSFRRPVRMEPVASPSPVSSPPVSSPAPQKYRTEIIIALIGAVATVCAACATVFATPLMEMLLPAKASPTSISTFTPQPTQYTAATLPPEISAPTFTLTPPPTLTLIPPPTATSQPVTVQQEYQINPDAGQTDFTIPVKTLGLLRIKFTSLDCSAYYLHIYWDGSRVYTTDPVPEKGSIDIDISSFISPGRHDLTLRPEAIASGCNASGLPIVYWNGTLAVYTNEYP